MSDKLRVSWDEYHQLIERLVIQLADSGWHFDVVMGLSRGGLRVADVSSRVLNKPFATLAASSYREHAGTEQGELVISSHIATTLQTLGPSVLVVDDLADSGLTLQAVVPHLLSRYPDITEVKTAVLWVKGCSVLTPDFFVQHLPDSPWIVQPFEVYDTADVDALRIQHRPAY